MSSISVIRHVTFQDEFAKLHSFEIKEANHPLGYEGKEEHPLGFDDRDYAVVYHDGNPVFGIEYAEKATTDPLAGEKDKLDSTRIVTILNIVNEQTGDNLSAIDATRMLGVNLYNKKVRVHTTYELDGEKIIYESSNRMNGLIVFSHRVTEDGMAKIIFTDDDLTIKGEVAVYAESFNSNVPAYILSVNVRSTNPDT